jgi:hypothetical protein
VCFKSVLNVNFVSFQTPLTHYLHFKGELTALPELVQQYTPPLLALPSFLLRMVTEVDWDSEKGTRARCLQFASAAFCLLSAVVCLLHVACCMPLCGVICNQPFTDTMPCGRLLSVNGARDWQILPRPAR